MLGTQYCHSFELLENHFGAYRCIGFDMYNITNRENIIEGSITNLPEDYIKTMAFVWNDLGNFSRTDNEGYLLKAKLRKK